MYANPIYNDTDDLGKKHDWYFELLTDEQCQEKLKDKGQGSFLVTSYPNSANKFFVIKNNNKLVKIDIIFNGSRGGFHVYNNTSKNEYFLTLAALVEYYSEPKIDFPF